MQISYALTCDHDGCPVVSPEGASERQARRFAREGGWQRWRSPQDVLLDYCPEHRRETIRRKRPALADA